MIDKRRKTEWQSKKELEIKIVSHKMDAYKLLQFDFSFALPNQ